MGHYATRVNGMAIAVCRFVHTRIERLHRRAAEIPGLIPLAGGLPADELLPRNEIADALRAVQSSPTALQYGWPEGSEPLRHWIAKRLHARGASSVTADDVVVTAGAQQAIALAAAELVDPGRSVYVGVTSYPAAISALSLRGGVPSASRAAACAHYAMAGVSNPSGRDLLGRERDALLASGAPIVVDEAYAELRFDDRSERPLLVGAEDRVWHVGTVSKTLCPGLRVGWLVPPAGFRERVLERKHAADLQAGSLGQAALAHFLDRFDYDAHVRRVRGIYRQRAETLVQALERHAPGFRFEHPEGGFSVWVETDQRCDDVALLACALRRGVSLDLGRLFRPDGARNPLSFRLCFSYAPRDALEEGVRRVVAAVRDAERKYAA